MNIMEHKFTKTMLDICEKNGWDWKQVCDELGNKWDYIVTSITIKHHLSQELLSYGLIEEYNAWSNQILFA